MDFPIRQITSDFHWFSATPRWPIHTQIYRKPVWFNREVSTCFFPHLALAKKIAERLELIIAHLDLPDHCLGITSDAIYWDDLGWNELLWTALNLLCFSCGALFFNQLSSHLFLKKWEDLTNHTGKRMGACISLGNMTIRWDIVHDMGHMSVSERDDLHPICDRG